MFAAYFAPMMEHWHLWTLVVLVLLIGEAFVPGLVLGSLAVGALAGGMVANLVWGIPYEVFFVVENVGYGDFLSGFLKAAAYGMAIPIAAAQAGLETAGGSEGVGTATTRAVVNASFCVVVLDFILSGFSFLFLFS